MPPVTEQRIREILKEELQEFLGSDRYIFIKTVQMLDGRNIQTGRGTGTKIGTATDQKVGFYGTTPVVQGAALTTQKTSITHTDPGTPDFAIQDLTQTNPFGFVTKDEGNTVLQVILNLQTRLAEVEARLEASGLIASN